MPGPAGRAVNKLDQYKKALELMKGRDRKLDSYISMAIRRIEMLQNGGKR